jgi:hypothetical protein
LSSTDDALLAQRRGDLARRDRAEQVAFGVGATFDRDRGFASFVASSFIGAMRFCSSAMAAARARSISATLSW